MPIAVDRITQKHAAQAGGVVIVIDVIRAFTVAAYAFAGGARRLWLVRTVEEAHALQEREPNALLAGEIGGRLIHGFDFNNSPSLMAAANVRDRILIQRTGAGTQGAVKVSNAKHLLLCSLTNARATASYARKLAMESSCGITMLPTATYEHADCRNEDDVCADYLDALLLDPAQAPVVLAEGIAYLRDTDRFDEYQQDDFDLPSADVPAILATDSFSFAMVGIHQQWEGMVYVDVERVDVSI
ncbi:MAG: 2-phosphosulfolactate phosphatase [Ktedonobacteraceae bacterium]